MKPYAAGEAYIAAGFLLGPETWLQPDVSFVTTAQIAAANTAAALDIRLQEYFAHGAEEVWLVYPKTKRVWIYHPDGRGESIATGLLESALFIFEP